MVAALLILLGTVLLLGALAAKPLRKLWKLLLNALLGMLMLLVFNALAGTLHLVPLPVNLLTVLLTGLLGVPGLLLLLCLQVLTGRL